MRSAPLVCLFSAACLQLGAPAAGLAQGPDAAKGYPSRPVRIVVPFPTIAESGLPGFRYDSWAALFAPSKTPRAIINRLNQEVARVLKLPDVEQRLHAVGIEPAPGTPAALDKFVAEQLGLARQLAQKAGIKPE